MHSVVLMLQDGVNNYEPRIVHNYGRGIYFFGTEHGVRYLNRKIVLVCRVAIGNIKRKAPDDIEYKLQPNENSFIVLGRYEQEFERNDIAIQDANIYDTRAKNDVYIVPNANQVKMEYIVLVNDPLAYCREIKTE